LITHHSSHLIIEGNGKEIPEKVLTIASEICAYYSRGRDGGKTEVVYTLRKNVKKPPKSKLGFCTYDNYKSMVVSPKKHTEFLKNE
jgi:predicted ribosome quality control (RQC) complex YloA/Tae2 family protein